MNVGDCYSTRALIWATRPLAFLVGLVIMTIATSLGELAGHQLNEPIAGILIMSLVLVPYFAVRVLGETLSTAIRRSRRSAAPRLRQGRRPSPGRPLSPSAAR